MIRVRIILCALISTLGLVSGSARAGTGAFHPELVRAVDALQRAARKAPATYTALRNIWQTWDRADPQTVEEALRNAAASPRLSPPERSYAATLAAYARIRRGDLVTARRELRALGYVDRWLVLGPFANEGKAGLGTALLPETQPNEPLGNEKRYEGFGQRLVSWRDSGQLGLDGHLELGELLRPESDICAFAASYVEDQAQRTGKRAISAFVGVSGAFKLYWNGVERLTDAAYRNFDPDRTAVSLWLHPGQNLLLVKICGGALPPVLSVRLAKADGAPDASLVFSSEQSQNISLTKRRGPELATGAPAQRAAGPLQRFNNLFDKSPGDPAVAEQFARYLLVTGGDADNEHRARDLARQAAVAEPTVQRLLLAAELAETSQRALWLDQAEPLAGNDPQARLEIEIGRAQLREQGLVWQQAFAHYQRALAIDPNDVRALRGSAALLSEAGFPRRALASLESAVERNPTSVTLLSLLATQLRHLGHATEAREAERRYRALRFDDRTQLTRDIELSMARRNREQTQRLQARALELDPDAVWSQRLAARAELRFGRPELALGHLQHALRFAPDDIAILRTLADLYGELGQRSEQVRSEQLRTEQLQLLRRILSLRPQDKETREYLAYIAPESEHADERFAVNEARFLEQRRRPDGGHARRTLVDLRVRTVYENGLASVFRQVVFQPLTNSAAALSSEYGFSYDATSQQVQLRGARVFRAGGGVERVVDTHETAADNPNIALYTGARNFYVTFPRLEQGDVVELRYRIDDVAARNEFADYFGELTYLGSNEPVFHSEYVLITPASKHLQFDVQRLPTLKREVSQLGEQVVHRFHASNLEPIYPEPAMPPWPEVLGYIHVSSYSSHRDLGRWYWGLIRDQLALDDELRKLAREITAAASSELDKVRAVYHWVIQNTRYVALEFGIYGYKPRRSVESLFRGWGDCKDKAAVIVSLLAALGIDAKMAIVRTQLRGAFDSQLPSLAPFDHAVAYVPSLNLYLDGTAELAGINELPAADAEAMALLVGDGTTELVELPPIDPVSARRSREIHAELRSDGSARLRVSLAAGGSHAPDWRRRYHAVGTRRERLAEDLARQFPGFVLSDGREIAGAGLDDFESPVRLEAAGYSPRLGRSEGSGISLNATLQTRLQTSYASLPSRKLDLKLPAIGTVEDTFTIELPGDLQVGSAVPDSALSGPFGSFEVRSTRSGNLLSIHSRLTVEVSRVKPSDYAQWREFCEAADAAFDHRLLLVPRGQPLTAAPPANSPFMRTPTRVVAQTRTRASLTSSGVRSAAALIPAEHVSTR